MNFVRTLTDLDQNCPKSNIQAEQLTVVTAFLDLSLVYGNSEQQNQPIRAFQGGRMVVVERDGYEWPPQARNASASCDVQSPDEICVSNQIEFAPLVKFKFKQLFAIELFDAALRCQNGRKIFLNFWRIYEVEFYSANDTQHSFIFSSVVYDWRRENKSESRPCDSANHFAERAQPYRRCAATFEPSLGR